MTGFSSVDLSSLDCTRQAFADSERHPDTLPSLPLYAAAATPPVDHGRTATIVLPRRMFFSRPASHGVAHDLRVPRDSPVLRID